MTSNQLPRSILNQLSVDAFKVELKKRLDDVQAQLACFELEQHALCERAVRARKHGRAALEFVREPEFNYYSWEEEPFILVKERDCCDTRIKVRVTSRWQRKLQQLAAKRKDLLETQRWLKRTPVDKPAIIAEIVRKDKEAVQGIEQIIHGVIQRRFFSEEV